MQVHELIATEVRICQSQMQLTVNQANMLTDSISNYIYVLILYILGSTARSFVMI